MNWVAIIVDDLNNINSARIMFSFMFRYLVIHEKKRKSSLICGRDSNVLRSLNEYLKSTVVTDLKCDASSQASHWN